QYKGESLYTAVNNWKIKAEGNAYSDYAFHLAISELNDNTMSELESVILNEGITSFKVYMAYKDTLMIDDAQIIALMEIAKKYNCIVLAHATNGHIINYLVSKFKWEGKLATLYHYLSQPAITEAEATGRFSDLAYITGARSYIVHLSCEEALNKIREVTKRNQKVYAETCIQYLLLDYSLYEQAADAIKWIISPPLREKKDQQALWAAINQGLIQTVATDHCPFLMKDKKVGEKDFSQVPNGMPGIENRVELLFSEGVKKGKITINKFVELISTNAAKIFGLFPQKGNITVGADADLVVFAPDEKHVISAKTHHMNCDYSCYEGLEVTGKCKTVILRGKIAIHDNEVYINKGFGKYIKRYHPMI
ncbi:MAG TPA: dihydropyrimidinase, partial [Bacteroidales bacterium]|nr:dihydropyrimidinase [Bacteroidales bacterium]